MWAPQTLFARLATESFEWQNTKFDENPCPLSRESESQVIASWKLASVNLRLRLAMTCVYLRRPAMTCVHFDPAQICTQANASFSPFGHQTQVDASWSQYCFPLYGRAWKAQWNGFFATSVEPAPTCESVWPLIASLCSQVHISSLALTCDSVWPGLYM